MRGSNTIERISQDLRFALRGLRQNPGFAMMAILVLALGTGANTAIFSIFHAVLLRPLSFQDPDRVMFIFEKIPKRGVNRSDLCAANFFDLQQRNHSFDVMAMLSGRGFALTGDDAAEQVPGALVSGSFSPCSVSLPSAGVPFARGMKTRAKHSSGPNGGSPA